MPSSAEIASSPTARHLQLVRNTGATGGVAFLAAGTTFLGRAVAISVDAAATLTGVTSPADASIYTLTGTTPAAVAVATGLALEAGLHFLPLTGFVSSVAAIVYLDSPLTPTA